MAKKHTENRLEDAIEHCLLSEHGYIQGESSDYDIERALEPDLVMAFIKATQDKGTYIIHVDELKQLIWKTTHHLSSCNFMSLPYY